MSLSSILLESIKTNINDKRETKYSIAVGSGVDHAVLRRFMRGERDIKLQTADKLATYLGLELVQKNNEKE